MKFRIVVVSGVSNGLVLPVDAGSILVGNDRANTLCLADPAVAQRHCRIDRCEGGYELIDLSESGTFLNGVPVRRKALSDGDTIRIGDSELLFALHEPKSEDAIALNVSPSPHPGELKTIRVDQATLDTEFANVVGRMARDLAALLKISNATVSTREIGQLQREILRLILEVIPADDGAIVLLTPSDDQDTSICSWNRKTGEKASIKVQADIVRRVFWERSAVITDAVQGTDGDRHVLCVPLVAVQRTLGVVYFTSTEAASPFLDDHVHFLISVSRIAAVALENILTLDALSTENRQLKEQMFSSKLVGESRPMRKLEPSLHGWRTRTPPC